MEKVKMAMRLIPASFECDINGEQFVLSGQISIVSGMGQCMAKIQFDRDRMPSGFEPELLSFVAITGYPDAAALLGNASNPFNDQNADFITTRELNLSSLGLLHAKYWSNNRETPNETLTFKISGSVKIPDRIIAITSTVEHWISTDIAGEFAGRMTFCWQLVTGELISGYATSVYALPTAPHLTNDQIRIITFDLEVRDDCFVQHEVIKLHDLQEWQSLKETRLVSALC
jgi:hypothetical protein